MKKLFGTDGIRGEANRYPMTPEVALSLGQAIAFYFARKKGAGQFVIGKDTRRSSYMFEYALCAGMSSMGATAILTGPLPTPAIAFITKTMRADAGVMISASHNIFSDNGIKFFDPDGFKLPDEVEKQIEDFVLTPKSDSLRPHGEQIGRAFRVDDASGRYIEFLKSTFPKNLNLKGLKIVVDCANGAGYKIGPQLFSEMGAEVISLGVKPNGTNINENCGALHPENMAKRVVAEKAHLGIAVDGDADRVILCDEKGKILDGDIILALCALAKKKNKTLTGQTVVGTVMTNMGLEVWLNKNDINLVRTAVGDRFIIEEMRKKGFVLGGEPSGHLVFMDHSTTGDGFLAALQVLSLLVSSKKSLSSLLPDLSLFPQVSQALRVKEKKDLSTISSFQKKLKEVEKKLKGSGRVIARYSGTEPVLRIMVEGKNEGLIKKYSSELFLEAKKNLL